MWIFSCDFNPFFIFQERQKNYDGLLKRIEDFEAKERLEKLEADISKSSPQPAVQEDLKTQLNECKTKITSLEEENSALKNQVELDDQQTVEPTPKYDTETQANIDNYLQVLSKYVKKLVANSPK